MPIVELGPQVVAADVDAPTPRGGTGAATSPPPGRVIVPPRPYSEWVIYFQLERHYVYQAILRRSPHRAANPFFDPRDPSQGYRGPPLPRRYAGVRFPRKFYTSFKDRKDRRKKYYDDGVISQRELSNIIEKNWENADDETRQYVRIMHGLEMEEYALLRAEYDRSMKLFDQALKEKPGAESARPEQEDEQKTKLLSALYAKEKEEKEDRLKEEEGVAGGELKQGEKEENLEGGEQEEGEGKEQQERKGKEQQEREDKEQQQGRGEKQEVEAKKEEEEEQEEQEMGDPRVGSSTPRRLHVRESSAAKQLLHSVPRTGTSSPKKKRNDEFVGGDAPLGKRPKLPRETARSPEDADRTAASGHGQKSQLNNLLQSKAAMLTSLQRGNQALLHQMENTNAADLGRTGNIPQLNRLFQSENPALRSLKQGNPALLSQLEKAAMMTNPTAAMMANPTAFQTMTALAGGQPMPTRKPHALSQAFMNSQMSSEKRKAGGDDANKRHDEKMAGTRAPNACHGPRPVRNSAYSTPLMGLLASRGEVLADGHNSMPYLPPPAPPTPLSFGAGGYAGTAGEGIATSIGPGSSRLLATGAGPGHSAAGSGKAPFGVSKPNQQVADKPGSVGAGSAMERIQAESSLTEEELRLLLLRGARSIARDAARSLTPRETRAAIKYLQGLGGDRPDSRVEGSGGMPSPRPLGRAILHPNSAIPCLNSAGSRDAVGSHGAMGSHHPIGLHNAIGKHGAVGSQSIQGAPRLRQIMLDEEMAEKQRQLRAINERMVAMEMYGHQAAGAGGRGPALPIGLPGNGNRPSLPRALPGNGNVGGGGHARTGAGLDNAAVDRAAPSLAARATAAENAVGSESRQVKGEAEEFMRMLLNTDPDKLRAIKSLLGS